MNTIRDYIEQIFKTVPLTKETLQLKTRAASNVAISTFAKDCACNISVKLNYGNS